MKTKIFASLILSGLVALPAFAETRVPETRAEIQMSFAPVVKENSDVAQALLKALTARIRSLESQG